MKRLIDVHRGEVMAGKGEVVLKSDDTRPCLVIAAYDANKKIGAVAHAMFSNGCYRKEFHPAVMKDTSAAIDEMIKDMEMLGSERDDIVVKLVSGENVHHEADDINYEQNIAEAINVLRDRHVKMQETVADDIEENLHVVLDVETGELNFR